jgi:hypothetical protein
MLRRPQGRKVRKGLKPKAPKGLKRLMIVAETMINDQETLEDQIIVEIQEVLAVADHQDPVLVVGHVQNLLVAQCIFWPICVRLLFSAK